MDPSNIFLAQKEATTMRLNMSDVNILSLACCNASKNIYYNLGFY